MIVPRETTVADTTTGSIAPVLPLVLPASGMATFNPDVNASRLIVSTVCNETSRNLSKHVEIMHEDVIYNQKNPEGYHFTDVDAFFYIIVVLSFYAVSIVLLMITYIRREREETNLDFYYTEYVKRPWFQQPVVQNRLAMDRGRKWLDNVLQGKSPSCQNSNENLKEEGTLLETHL